MSLLLSLNTFKPTFETCKSIVKYKFEHYIRARLVGVKINFLIRLFVKAGVRKNAPGKKAPEKIAPRKHAP